MARPLLLACAVLALGMAVSLDFSPKARWWKGNTHTHTLWSDGDAAPEHAVDWYKRHGYQFLVLSEHNTVARSERWFPVSEDGAGRLKPAEVQALIDAFGEDEVLLRPRAEGGREMRLRTLPELEARFVEDGKFLLVTGEEVTASYRPPAEGEAAPKSKPVHVNAINIADYVPPRGGDSVVDVMNKALGDIASHGVAAGRPVTSHVNHPNFGWGVTTEDLAAMQSGRHFEVHNGHRSVHNEGDATRPSTEAMWDAANLSRANAGLPLLLGIASDDTHEYFGGTTCPPGRAWVMVRAESLDADEITRALDRGDYYATTGVLLDDVRREDDRLVVDIASEPGVTYTTRFHGARRGATTAQILFETAADPAVFEFQGDEVFVRAAVTSSALHEDPYTPGDVTRCWTQPTQP